MNHYPLTDSLTKSGRDLFQIAVKMAGFDAQQLLLTIYRLQHGRDTRANARTVEKAMGVIRCAPFRPDGDYRGRPCPVCEDSACQVKSLECGK